MKAIDFLKNIINESSTPIVSLKAEYGEEQWNGMLKRGIRYYLNNATGAEICFAQVQPLLPEIATDLGWDGSDKVSAPRSIKPRIVRSSNDGIKVTKSFEDLLVEMLVCIDNETDIKRKMKMISRVSDLVTSSVLRMTIQFKNCAETDEMPNTDEVINEEENVDHIENEEVTPQPENDIHTEEEPQEENNYEEQKQEETENEVKTEEIDITEEVQADNDPRTELIENIESMLDATGFTAISFGGFDFIKKKSWLLGRKKIENLDIETLEAIKEAEGLVQFDVNDNSIDEYAESLEEAKEETEIAVEDPKEETTDDPNETKAESKEEIIKEIEEILRATGADGIDLENKCRFTSGTVTAETTAVFLKKDELNLHVVCVEGRSLGQERTVKASYQFVTLESLISIRDEIKESLKK